MHYGERVYNYAKFKEGLRLVADARDTVPTLGYGHTQGVKVGDRCTSLQAETWLHQDLDFAERCVLVLLSARQVSQGVFDALVDFCFNAGPGSLEKSGIVQAIKAFDMVLAGKLLRTKNVHDQHGTLLPGLVTRREQELAWFNEGDLSV